MSSNMIEHFTLPSANETVRFAAHMGAKLRGSEVIELVSDIGGGKTTFVRGLAKGMGSSDRVSSPSFTLTNEYRADLLTMYHFDFYRLSEPGIMAAELAEIITDSEAVVVVEWATIVEGILPSEHIAVSITASDEVSRELTVSCPNRFAYLLPGDQ